MGSNFHLPGDGQGRHLLLAGIVAVTACAFASSAPGSSGTPTNITAGARAASVPGRLLVRFRSTADRAERAAVRSSAGVEIKRRLSLPDLELVGLTEGTSVGEGIRELESQPEVKYAEPDFIYRTALTTPNDEAWSFQYGLNNIGGSPLNGTPDADIDAPEAWDSTTGRSSVTVAVADSGVAFGHPDLGPNLLSTGYDFVQGDANASDPLATGSDRGHGTLVAGIIGARGNNQIGIAGVNWNVGIEPIRVCDGAACTGEAIISAINYARDQGVPVFNGSLGGYIFSQAMKDAIDGAPNVLFVFSAGNDSTDTDVTPQYPCAYQSPNIICVAATDWNDRLWSGSNYGANSVDLAAPGHEIVSTSATYEANPLASASGTSFAAPFVSGAAALLLSVTPGASPAQLKSTILGEVDPLASLNGKVATGGRLNLDRIVPNPPDTTIDSGPGISGTTDSTPTFSFSATRPGSTFECALQGSEPTFTACTSPKTYDRLPDGSYSFKVSSIDPAGISDPTPASREIRVDTTGPESQILRHPGKKTSDRRAKFSFRYLPERRVSPDFAVFECRLDRSRFKRCRSPMTIRVEPGRHTLQVRAADKLGNTGRPVRFSWKVTK